MVARRSSTHIEEPGFARPTGRASKRKTNAGPVLRSAAPCTRSDLTIRAEDPKTPDARTLIEESQSALMKYLPEDEIFSIDYDDLSAPNVTFFVARAGVLPVGCVALVDNTTYGEIKRLYIHETFRGQGIAQALMADLEQFCRDVGLLVVKLETSPLLKNAEKFYRGIDYQNCAPFGDYPVLESSLFMQKELGRLF